MLGGIKSYIIFNYLKYILINITIFIGLIWLSQILRILELQQSITPQLFDIIKTTLLVLPSFIGPLMPFLLIITSFFLNYKFNNSNEIIILKQYFSIKNHYILFLIISFGISLFYFINNEILSVNLYQKYKIQELEIRNNLKLGLPTLNEFHIEQEVSIFFDKQIDNKFYGVKAIIFKDGQFINSEKAKIEIEKKNYNIIFQNGERIILNKSEKSKTNFDKFIYSIENNEIEILMYDKEHFNTYELLNKKDDKEFYFHGHNRIYQYFLILIIILISFRVFFFNTLKRNAFKYYTFIFICVLLLQVLNSYMIYLLNNNNLNLYFYYLTNISILFFLCLFIYSFNENN